jgi:uncharacterized protein YdiU (UPF0061 family)
MSIPSVNTPLVSLFTDAELSFRLKELQCDPLTRDFPLTPIARKQRLVAAGTIYSLFQPQTYTGPTQLITVNQKACVDVGLDWSEAEKWNGILVGTLLPRGALPHCHRYGGHQFNNWAGQLGDGRCYSLGHFQQWELSIKGIGITPYSRNGNGLLTIGEACRELILSESLHQLEIPSSRVLSIHATSEKGQDSVCMLRTAHSFFRIGTWELLFKEGALQSLQRLTDHVMEHYFRETLNDVAGFKTGTNKYGRFLLEVARKNAAMVAGWMAFGFVHGTVNTDNISPLGITLDMTGASCFLDVWDEDYSPNTSDLSRVHTFGKQKEAVRLAVESLAHSLNHLVKDRLKRESKKVIMDEFDRVYETSFISLMRKRLGITKSVETDRTELIDPLIHLLDITKADVTILFRSLGLYRVYIPPIRGSSLPIVPRYEEMLVSWHSHRGDGTVSTQDVRLLWRQWLDLYQQRLFLDTPWGSLIEYDRKKSLRMRSSNPKTLARGWILLHLDRDLKEWMSALDVSEEDSVEGFETDSILSRLEAITRHLQDKPRHTKEPPVLSVALKILLQDMFGQVSEEKGHGSFTSDEIEQVNLWAGEPREDSVNPPFPSCT